MKNRGKLVWAASLLLGFSARSELNVVHSLMGFCKRGYALVAGRPQSFADLPNLSALPLPPEAKAMIHRHTISELGKRWNSGKGLRFEVSHYDPQGKISSSMGETIQSSLVVNTLKEAFPNAEFAPADRSRSFSAKEKRSDLKTIRLTVVDRAEMPKAFGLEGGPGEHNSLGAVPVIDMPILKPANPSVIPYSREKMRNMFGVGKDQFALSLYFQSLPEFSQPNSKRPLPEDILALLETQKKPDIVFLSIGGQKLSQLSPKLQEFARGKYEVIPLSQVKPSTLQKGKRYLVLNDVSGKMPYVHGLSDLAFVSGPVNLFEPLAVKTPTIFMNNPSMLNGYFAPTFEKMAQTAQATGGAFGISSLEELTATLAPALKSQTNINRPFESLQGGQNSFQDYLDHLEDIVRRSR